MKRSASIAAPSCRSIKSDETAESRPMAACAPTPLKNVGSANKDTAARTIRLARWRSSFFPASRAQKESKTNNGADNRKVIQDQVDMRQIHRGVRSKALKMDKLSIYMCRPAGG